MEPELLKWIFAYGALLLQILLLAILLVRRLHKQFPFFCLYLTFNVASTLAVLVSWTVFGSYETYFYLYWISAPITAMLALALIHELYVSVLQANPQLGKASSDVFRWTMLLMLPVAALTSLVYSGNERTQLTAVLMGFLSGIRIIQAGLLVALVMLVRSLGLTWSGLSHSIGLGYGLFAVATAMAGTLRMYFGTRAEAELSLFVPAAYFAAVVVWTSGVLQTNTRAEEGAAVGLSRLELEEWNHSLIKVLRRS